MKFTGILGVGTYYSPWLPYTLKSLYPVVDEIIVVNGGFNLRNPNKAEYNIPLPEVTRTISHMDLERKVLEISDWTLDSLEHKLQFSTQFEATRNHLAYDGWFDSRGVNLTLANEIACKRGADWILKIDSDQVLYKDCERLPRGQSLLLHQYEFQGDIRHLADPGPNSPFNDSVFSYRASREDYFGGGGSPHISSSPQATGQHHCAHLRHANPPGASREECFEHFYGRLAFRLYTGEYGEWTPELLERARHDAANMLSLIGRQSEIGAPEVLRTLQV